MNTEERVELHCHSKFSGNAVMYAGEIIRHLSERSMPAVAITDTSNILAFPEEEHVMSTGNYSTRPIFAMEALIDGDNTKVTILVKNETGKKNIIKLVSNAEDEAFPVFEIKEILKNREGLLLGSGACDGVLYRMLENKKTEETVLETMKLFDYIEVIPDEELAEHTKKLIE